jgi:alpha-glucosidase (family GH31 glycosyl hydrolase)
MPDIIAVFPTVVFQIMGDSIVMRVASEVGTGLKEVLRGHLGQTVVTPSDYTKKQTDTSVSLTWKDGNLKISHYALDNNVHRYDFFWTAGKPNKLSDTLEMIGSHWYGGAQVRKMVWPVEKMKFKTAPFVAGDSYKDGEWGGVQERYWLSSKGIGVFVKPDVPLFVGLNESDDGKLRLVAKYDGPYRNHSGSTLQLRYSIYHGPDIMTTHKTVSREMIPRPTGIPDKTMFRLPLWSTWAICKEDIDQEKVLMLANQIKSYGINTSQLQIDDHWAVHRGDWDFNRDKFPNPREMVQRLNDAGFRVTIWVHPFANMRSSSIKKTDLFVKGMAKGAIKWWTGIGRILDITKPTTVEWYKKQLNLLRENYAIDSFKFDGGEATWLPKKWSLHKECNNPNMYTKKYAELAYEMDKKWKSVEVRVGVRTQKLPIFVRMMDKDSVWGEKNGLRSIIPHALLYGIIGFPFFIPDMVGGNAYDMDRPTKSLFIRWVQVCTFMPSIQFSLPPWWFDNQTVRITKKMLAIRAKHTELLIKLAKEATETGNPIIRPLWWVAPEDDFALKCDDQFMVGNDLLVAPVLTKGAKTRPLYLPAGRWRDEKSLHVLEGSKWYFEYMVSSWLNECQSRL